MTPNPTPGVRFGFESSQVVTAKVIEVYSMKGRVSLSIKALLDNGQDR